MDKLDVDDEKVILEDREHLEKQLTGDDFVYLDRRDIDFYNYYLNNQKSYSGISLGKKNLKKDYTLLYELKVMFIACKICKNKS
jgi:hypothetical protein